MGFFGNDVGFGKKVERNRKYRTSFSFKTYVISKNTYTT
jgi:hypothetical protein